MDDSANQNGGQLPLVQNQGSQQPGQGVSPQLSAGQLAQGILSDASRTPYQMAQQLAQLRAQHLASLGVKIGD